MVMDAASAFGLCNKIYNMSETKRQVKKLRKIKTKKKKAARKTKVTAPAKPSNRRKISRKKVRPPAKKKRSAKRASKEIRSPEASTLGGSTFSTGQRRLRSGRGSGAAGQSGDVPGLSRKAVADSESVEELIEEGQALEAAAISGVEDALDPDQAEVHTRQVPEDDVPEEYTEDD